MKRKRNMFSKSISGTIIGIIAIVLSVGFFIYQESKPPEITVHMMIELMKNGQVEEFNDIRNERYEVIDLVGLNIEGVDLIGINLDNTKFTNSNFTNVKLNNAHMKEIQFSGTMNNVDLTDTFARGAIFDKFNGNKLILNRTLLQDSKFTETTITNSNFDHTELVYAKLPGIAISNSTFAKTQFWYADLSCSQVVNSILIDPQFINTTLTDSWFITNLKEKDFKEAGEVSGLRIGPIEEYDPNGNYLKSETISREC